MRGFGWVALGFVACGGGGGGAAGDDDDDDSGALACPDVDPATEWVSADAAQVLEMHGDASHLYWADGQDYGVHRVDKASGAVDDLYRPMGAATVLGVALDADFVYFVEGSITPPFRVKRVPKAGGAAESLAELDAFPWGFTVDDTAIYAAIGGAASGQELVVVSKGGGEPTVIADIGGSTFGLAVAEGRVWWTAFEPSAAVNLRSVAVSGGSVTVHGSTQCQGRVEVDGSDLWCTSLDTVERFSLPSGEGVVVLSGVGTRGFEHAVGFDGFVTAVGGLEAAGEVRRARRDGSDEEILSCAQNFPNAVVVDADAVWVGNGGSPSITDPTGGIRRIGLR
jgi:hypothetical protein